MLTCLNFSLLDTMELQYFCCNRWKPCYWSRTPSPTSEWPSIFAILSREVAWLGWWIAVDLQAKPLDHVWWGSHSQLSSFPSICDASVQQQNNRSQLEDPLATPLTRLEHPRLFFLGTHQVFRLRQRRCSTPNGWWSHPENWSSSAGDHAANVGESAALDHSPRSRVHSTAWWPLWAFDQECRV